MSGRKNSLKAFKIVSAGDMSTTSITSAVTDITTLDNVCIQAIWTGTSPVGTLSVQGSNDYFKDPTTNTVINTGTWTSLQIDTAVSGNTGNAMYDLNQLSFPYIRVIYTKGSGTGTLNVYISGKQV